MQRVNLIIFTTFVPFFPLDLARHAGKGSLFVGRVQPFNSVFFLHTLLLSSFLNQRPESGMTLMLQRFIYALLSHSPSLSASFSLILISSVQRWRSGEEEHSLHTGQILHAGRLGGERGAESVSV